jgi:tetratricopeptide (TPR) repeat protein
MKRASSATLAAVLVLGLAAAAEAQDIVRLRSGTEVKCKVNAMTSQSVIYTEAGKGQTTAKKEDVSSVELADKPPSMGKGDAAMAASQYDKAIAQYGAALEEIAKDSKKWGLQKQFVLFQWAQALALKGAPSEALEKYRQLRNEIQDSWLRIDTYQRSLELAKVKGGDAYETILKEMKGEPEPVGSQAELELAKLKYTGGEFDVAKISFDKVASNPASPFASDAKLFSLRCVRGLKKMDELESTCKRILEEKTANSPALVQAAGAWMADILLKKSEKDKTKWRDILMVCVQAIALGPPAGREEGEDYALALLTGAKCYVLMGNANEKAEAKDEYKQRATAYLTEIKRGYGKTAVGPLAEKELVALGAAEAPKEAPKAPNK